MYCFLIVVRNFTLSFFVQNMRGKIAKLHIYWKL